MAQPCQVTAAATSAALVQASQQRTHLQAGSNQGVVHSDYSNSRATQPARGCQGCAQASNRAGQTAHLIPDCTPCIFRGINHQSSFFLFLNSYQAQQAHRQTAVAAPTFSASSESAGARARNSVSVSTHSGAHGRAEKWPWDENASCTAHTSIRRLWSCTCPSLARLAPARRG